MTDTPILDVRNLTVQYESENGTIVSNRAVSLSVYPKEITGLIGYNASGKSSLIKACMGLLLEEGKITSGNVFFGDQDITEKNGEEFLTYQNMMQNIRGSQMTAVFQNPGTYFDPTMKIGKQVMEMLDKKSFFHSRETKKKAAELLKEFDIADAEKVMKRFPMELSGGTLQKISLAMALSVHPKMLFLDEPFNALDKLSKEKMLEVLERYQKEYGIAVLLVSHDLQLIRRLCANVYVMLDGKIEGFGVTDDILERPTNPFIKEYVELQKEKNSEEERAM